jgi:tryptophan synthase alpha chain
VKSTDRIEKVFQALRAQKRAAFIPFIMGYDPNPETTAALLDALPRAGADLIEIGLPFSDPMADGPVIQAAGRRALAAGATISGILKLVRAFRKKYPKVPVILMGYFNPIYRYGNEKFCKDATAAGVDGVIIVDLPPEEENEMQPYLNDSGLKLIRLIAPTSDDSRLPLLAESASGFVYYISVTGITGAKTATSKQLKSKIAKLRKFTKLPIAVGFGIKTPAQAKEAAQFGDAVVVGSALVEVISKQKSKSGAVKAATTFVKALTKQL